MKRSGTRAIGRPEGRPSLDGLCEAEGLWGTAPLDKMRGRAQPSDQAVGFAF